MGNLLLMALGSCQLCALYNVALFYEMGRKVRRLENRDQVRILKEVTKQRKVD